VPPGAGLLLLLLGWRDRADLGLAVVEHLVAGILLGLAFACVILPALCALAGPDEP
jgi:hypothetical protein